MNRDTTTIYYKIYYTTKNGHQSFNWTQDKIMVRPMVEAIKKYGHTIDYIAQVVTKTTVREHKLEVMM